MNNFRISNILKFAGAIIAYLIGAGFASGQEAMQYFASFGLKGIIGAGMINLVIYVWFTTTLMKNGYELKLSNGNKIFSYYCGEKLGKIFEIYTPIFLYLVFIIMISGAGSILHEYYGLNLQIGKLLMAVLSLITVLLGLKRLVDIISKLAPIIILFAITVGIINIVQYPSGLLESEKIITQLELTKAAPSWYISGFIFPAMGCLIIAPFLIKMGSISASAREAKTGGAVGGLVFSIAVIIMSLGILATISDLYQMDIPALFIIKDLFPQIGVVFSIILFLGVYTTAVPMLWLSVNTITKNEQTKTYRWILVLMTIIAFIGGQFSFAKLVNILYPISGYFGIIFMIFILIKQLKNYFNQ